MLYFYMQFSDSRHLSTEANENLHKFLLRKTKNGNQKREAKPLSRIMAVTGCTAACMMKPLAQRNLRNNK